MAPDPFDIRTLLPDFAAIEAGCMRASVRARATLRCERNVAYGSGPDETLDLFFPAAVAGACPVHLFVHGGYWRANRKEGYSFVAGPLTEAGAIAAVMDYSLMPAARMATLVDQVRRAAAWLAAHAADFGGDRRRLSASGHSAGGHLASFLAARGADEAAPPPVTVRALLLVSGIYDLAPIRQSFLQAELALTTAEAAAFSPLSAEQLEGPQRIVAVGGGETAPFHAQAAALGAGRAGWRLETLAALDHMRILAEMGDSRSAMGRLLVDTALEIGGA